MSDPYRFLMSLGWQDFFSVNFTECTGHSLEESNRATPLPARIIGQGKGHYSIQTISEDTLQAAVASKFHSAVNNSTGFPTVGDWVTYTFEKGNSQATIHHLLKRKSLIQRRRSNLQQELQLIAANVDFMLIVTSLEKDLDLQRLGQYVNLGRDSGSVVVLLLTKADLCNDPKENLAKIQAEFENLETFAISNTDLQSMSPLEKFFAPGKTAVLVGSSGAGKSTLTNFLLGAEAQKTQTLSADSRGRHTTTARNLRFTRFGGMVIDTPGMQEISSADPQEDLETSFSDIEDLTLRCKFSNCQHKSEPGCAILGAIKTEELSSERWQKYLSAKTKADRVHKKRPR